MAEEQVEGCVTTGFSVALVFFGLWMFIGLVKSCFGGNSLAVSTAKNATYELKEKQNVDKRPVPKSADGSQVLSPDELQAKLELDIAYSERVTKYAQELTAWNKTTESRNDNEAKRSELEAMVQAIEDEEPTAPSFKERKWSTNDLKYKTNALLVRSDEVTATLNKSDGSAVTISIEKLSLADLYYLKVASSGVESFKKKFKKWEGERKVLTDKLSTVMSKIQAANSPKPIRPTKLQIAEELASSKLSLGFKYTDDDRFPDVYAFRTVGLLEFYLSLEEQNNQLTPSERFELGIELVEVKTRVMVVSIIPFKVTKRQITTLFEIIPMAGRQEGKRLFVSEFDVFDSLR